MLAFIQKILNSIFLFLQFIIKFIIKFIGKGIVGLILTFKSWYFNFIDKIIQPNYGNADHYNLVMGGWSLITYIISGFLIILLGIFIYYYSKFLIFLIQMHILERSRIAIIFFSLEILKFFIKSAFQFTVSYFC